MFEQLMNDLSHLDILDWAIVAAIGLCGFVWLLLPFIICGPRMFNVYFRGPLKPPLDEPDTGQGE